MRSLLLLAILLVLQISLKTTEANMLALPLRSQVVPSANLPRSSQNKLSFQHNVSLTVSVTVGTPPQPVNMVIDTGSELSWLHCTTNNNNNNSRVVPDRFFYPNSSTSFSSIPCSSPTCTTRTRDFPIPASCDASNLCHATLSYADSSSSEGDLASDTFGLNGSGNPGVVFGCMNSSFSSNANGDSNTAGLLGMNLGSLSLISQLNLPKFSYCISGNDSSGVLILGSGSGSGSLNYTPLVRISTPLPSFDRSAYTVKLVGIKVAEKLVNISPTVLVPDHTGAGQTMFDLGTQFTFLLGPAYTALREEFLRQTNGTLRVLDEPNFVFQIAMDLCYLIPMTTTETELPELPSVSLVFDGAEMKVSGERLLYRVPGEVRGNDSVHCFTFGNSDLLGVEAFIIGHYQQQNMLVEFDLAGSRVGLASQVDCGLVGQRLLT